VKELIMLIISYSIGANLLWVEVILLDSLEDSRGMIFLEDLKEDSNSCQTIEERNFSAVNSNSNSIDCVPLKLLG
jgi:hypothetical protein